MAYPHLNLLKSLLDLVSIFFSNTQKSCVSFHRRRWLFFFSFIWLVSLLTFKIPWFDTVQGSLKGILSSSLCCNIFMKNIIK
jgi:hypothetical protein